MSYGDLSAEEVQGAGGSYIKAMMNRRTEMENKRPSESDKFIALYKRGRPPEEENPPTKEILQIDNTPFKDDPDVNWQGEATRDLDVFWWKLFHSELFRKGFDDGINHVEGFEEFVNRKMSERQKRIAQGEKLEDLPKEELDDLYFGLFLKSSNFSLTVVEFAQKECMLVSDPNDSDQFPPDISREIRAYKDWFWQNDPSFSRSAKTGVDRDEAMKINWARRERHDALAISLENSGLVPNGLGVVTAQLIMISNGYGTFDGARISGAQRKQEVLREAQFLGRKQD